jgi:hypothetical protein
MSIDKYFDELGNFLGDDLKGDNIRIMSKDTWDMLTEGENITELADVLQSAAPLFTQANLSEAAQLNVYNHFNTTGLPLTADNTSTNAGMIYRVSRTNGEVSEKIIVRLDANNRSGTSNRQSEVTNMFEHEGVHQVQYSQSGGFDNWKNLPNAVNERGAITHQVKHPSFSTTRQSYKDTVYRYGDRFGLTFVKPLSPLPVPILKPR